MHARQGLCQPSSFFFFFILRRGLTWLPKLPLNYNRPASSSKVTGIPGPDPDYCLLLSMSTLAFSSFTGCLMARNRWLSDSETSLVFMPSSRLARASIVRLWGHGSNSKGSVVLAYVSFVP